MARGQSLFEVLTWVALFAVTAVVITLFLTKIYTGTEDSFGARETCRLSVLGHTATQYRIDNVAVTPELISIDCKRRLITVTKDHIELNGKKISYWDGSKNKTIKKYDAPSRDVMNAVVADEIAGCWYQFMGGKDDFLVDYLDPVTVNKQRSCFICSEISFDKEARDAWSPEGGGFLKYITEIKIRKGFVIGTEQPTLYKQIFNDATICYEGFYKDPSGKLNCIERYMDIFAADPTGGKTFLESLQYSIDEATHYGIPFDSPPTFVRDMQFSPEKTYAVVFYREGGSFWAKHKDAVKGAIVGTTFLPGTGTLLGAVLGSDFDDEESAATYFAWVLDANQLNSNMCDEYFA